MNVFLITTDEDHLLKKQNIRKMQRVEKAFGRNTFDPLSSGVVEGTMC